MPMSCPARIIAFGRILLILAELKKISASYRMEETIGEIATGESQSASYKLKAGYQQMQEMVISLTSPAM